MLVVYRGASNLIVAFFGHASVVPQVAFGILFLAIGVGGMRGAWYLRQR